MTKYARFFIFTAFAVGACSVATAQSLNGRLEALETTPSAPYHVVVLDDGTAWATVGLDGIMSVDPGDGSMVRFVPTVGSGDPPQLFRPSRAPDDTLWITDTKDRLWHFDPTTHAFTQYDLPYPLFPDVATPFAAVVGPDGAVWFVCFNYRGIGRLDPTGPTWQRFEPPGTDTSAPLDLVFDDAGDLWFTFVSAGSSGETGLGRYRSSSGVFDRWISPYPGAITPYGILIHGGLVWFADSSGGQIVDFDPLAETFTTHPFPYGLADASFLARDRKGLLYTVGESSSTLAAFDPITGEWTVRRLAHGFAMPYGIAAAANGDIWWAEYGTGDYRGVGRLTPYGPAALAIGVPEEDVGAINAAGAVNVLYGSRGAGLTGTHDQIWDQDDLGTDPAEDSDRLGHALAAGDFDGDGRMDLAAGAPYEDIGAAVNGGGVQVVYAAFEDGLSAAGNQWWHQGSPGIDGAVETLDQFGTALAAGDFDGDGYCDLAVGVPQEDLEGVASDAGCVNVLYGSSNGLNATGNEIWHQDSSNIGDLAEDGDGFGRALAVGDFNGDGRDDLAIGVPDDRVAGNDGAGLVNVLYGSVGGLTATGNQVWYEGLGTLQGSSDPDDSFGEALAVGDFENDGYDDLVIGVPGEWTNSMRMAGAVVVLRGSANGLVGLTDQLFSQDDPLLLDDAESLDRFGSALTVGDFNGDGYADLAVGVLGEASGGETASGATAVIYGTSTGLHTDDNQLWHQDSPGVPGGSEPNDNFGYSLAAGDFDDDGIDDLAVGTPFEDISTTVDAGAVTVLFGSWSGLTANGAQFWHQGMSEVAGAGEEDDRFGYALVGVYAAPRGFFMSGFETGDLSGWSQAVP